MRPGQQNRRTRRGNNNRKAPNPLARSYESNGPDVKIRGSAQQIADKYLALARDAQSSGDRVIAENYLQHAEHYSRIIAAAQAQAATQAQRDNRDDTPSEEASSNDTAAAAQTGTAEAGDRPSREPAPSESGSGPQPVIDGTPVEVAIEEEAAASEGGSRTRGRGRKSSRPAPNEANGAAPQAAASDDAAPNGKAADADDEQQSRRPRRPRSKIAISQETAEPDTAALRPAEDGAANETGDQPDTPSIATG